MNQDASERPHPRDDNWIPACFGPNQQKIRPLDLVEYAGKHIALGIRTDRVVYDYVNPIWEPTTQ
jgi:hypothetical protein